MATRTADVIVSPEQPHDVVVARDEVLAVKRQLFSTPMREDDEPVEESQQQAPLATQSVQQMGGSTRDPIDVVLRIRPFTVEELRTGAASEATNCIEVVSSTTVVLHPPPLSHAARNGVLDGGLKRYTVSHVFGPDASQRQLFDKVTAPVPCRAAGLRDAACVRGGPWLMRRGRIGPRATDGAAAAGARRAWRQRAAVHVRRDERRQDVHDSRNV